MNWTERRWEIGRLAAIGALGLVAWASAGCGAGYCGDGEVNGDEQCDDGNDIEGDACTNACLARLPDTNDAVIKWVFNKDAGYLFDADGCFDMQASRVVVELEGTDPLRMEEESCSFRQVTFIDLAPGDYTAKLSVLDSDGNLLTRTPILHAVTVSAGRDLEEEIVIGFDDWVRDYTGTFFFRVSWGGADCTDAVPVVVEHQLLLEHDGVAVSQVTDVGDAMDGSQPGACRSLAEEFPQNADDVPWGPATFTVVGLDDQGVERYRSSFDTFVGAGLSNPEMDFDISTL